LRHRGAMLVIFCIGGPIV
jgi:hypothetical protein